jgi:hypothetical protein
VPDMARRNLHSSRLRSVGPHLDWMNMMMMMMRVSGPVHVDLTSQTRPQLDTPPSSIMEIYP